MYTDSALSTSSGARVICRRGGRNIVPRQRAPLGRLLPYRRAAGERPATSSALKPVQRDGWSAVLGDRGIGDTLLALGLVEAMRHATGSADELHYSGPLPRLMRRCDLPLRVTAFDGRHRIGSRPGIAGRLLHAMPEHDPIWLDLLDEQRVEIHSALPMRYYLAAEQALGVRLPAEHAPAPTFSSPQKCRPFHVVFVAATSWPRRKDYGLDRFTKLAEALTSRLESPWTFTLLPGAEGADRSPAHGPMQVLHLDAADCIDVFAAADVVVGNDTGLTHLAALTARDDGTGPHVIGLYGRHAHTKWTTGRARHHAVATELSDYLSVADRCPVRDRLDDTVWGSAASLTSLTPALVADFVGHVTGWW